MGPDFIFSLIGKYLSNNTGNIQNDFLHGSYWADQKDSQNKVIMTSLQGQ